MILQIFADVTAWVDDGVLKKHSREEMGRLLDKVASETAIKWHKASNGFLLTGTFKQVTDSRVLLGHYLKNSQSTDSRSKIPSESYDKDGETEEDGKHTATVDGVVKAHGPKDTRGSTNGEDQVEEAESAELKPQQYETTQKFFPLFVKAHEDELRKIENDFQVEVSRNIDDGKVTVAPRKHCTVEAFNEACEAFITLYQKVHQCMKLEQFLPKDQDSPVHIRQRIRDMGKTLPVLVEKSDDRKHWQVYGEESYVEKVLNDLEKENLISRKRPVTPGAEAWNRDEVEKNNAGFDDQNQLEHMLGKYTFHIP